MLPVTLLIVHTFVYEPNILSLMSAEFNQIVWFMVNYLYPTSLVASSNWVTLRKKFILEERNYSSL